MVSAIYAPGPGVKAYNDLEYLYLKGDADTDGSMRIVVDIHGDHFEFQVREDGVWNRSGIDIDGDPVLNLGYNTALGVAGNHLRTWNEGQDHYATYAHRHYTDTGGSTESHDDPVFGALVTRSVFQPDDSGVLATTSSHLDWDVNFSVVDQEAMIRKVYLKVAVSATDDVTVTVRRDSHTGQIIQLRNFAASAFVADAEVEVDFPGWIEDFGGVTLHFELDVANSGSCSLKADVTNTNAWTAFDYMHEDHEHVAPMEYTNDAMITDPLGFDLVLTTDGNPTFTEPNFSQQGIE